MGALVKRDKKLRYRYFLREKGYLECKSLYHNRFLDGKYREQAGYNLQSLGCSPVKIVNRCVITGRSGGVLREFKVSRMEFKRAAAKGYYLGIKKGSW